jgi:hypothetical protein
MSAANGFTVDPSQLRVAANTMAESGEDALGQLGLAHAAAGQGAEAVGNLNAADAILRFDTRWGRQLHELTELITGVQAGLDLSADAYERADHESAANIQRMRP